MPRLSKERRNEIQQQVLSWYRANKRDLAWRRTRDPYRILVSEIMLQQTQVSRVIPKYEEFLRHFPTVNVLANASRADVITAWKGLGYNRRALNLHQTAKLIAVNSNLPLSNLSGWKHDLAWLMSLPGIGRYTAGAIMNFAFGIDTPAVDTNVKQFIGHFVPSRRRRSEREYYELAEQLMPTDKARVWLHAVMDYSALVLKPMPPRHSTGRQKAPPFVGSNRYLRGRTLDRLRDRSQTVDELFRTIAAPIDVERDRYEHVVSALEKEGFLMYREGFLQLHNA